MVIATQRAKKSDPINVKNPGIRYPEKIRVVKGKGQKEETSEPVEYTAPFGVEDLRAEVERRRKGVK